METPSWTTYAAAWLATATLLLLSTTLRRRRKLNLPPGPTPWPIIGNLNLIGSLPHRSLDSLSQKYGPIMHLRFGSFPVVVGSTVDMAKVFLKTMDVTFASRPKTAAGKYTTYNYSDITWSPYGPYWRQARRMCLMELFSAKRLESYEYIRVEEMKALLKELHGSAGEPVMLKNHLSTGYIKRMKIVAKKFDRFLEHVLDEHNARKKEEAGNFVAKDMVDVLLQLAEDPNLEIKLERHGVKAFTQKEDLDMEELFGLSMPKKFPLAVVAKPRLPLPLYTTMHFERIISYIGQSTHGYEATYFRNFQDNSQQK
ncbi:hypothetical protein RHMOL_Rhmol08G0316300 [Rhododendron molle]|uniref:Uncharacterized protein n=1 Tax=Rhododendron molle TaxID=49168 RepID=A0ACC0MVV1_RHOML|nr:hypothetical protein RHMOL_Rhmol08G0316300 [Rhododendron molle]